MKLPARAWTIEVALWIRTTDAYMCAPVADSSRDVGRVTLDLGMGGRGAVAVAVVLAGIIGGGCVQSASEVTPGGQNSHGDDPSTIATDGPASGSAGSGPGDPSQETTTGGHGSDSLSSGSDGSSMSTSAAQTTGLFGSSTSEGVGGGSEHEHGGRP